MAKSLEEKFGLDIPLEPIIDEVETAGTEEKTVPAKSTDKVSAGIKVEYTSDGRVISSKPIY